jgi:hypothetical protein
MQPYANIDVVVPNNDESVLARTNETRYQDQFYDG